MRLVAPAVEIITEQDPLKRMELAARVCYKSEGKITADSALPLLNRLLARRHMTPFEHARVVLDIHNKPPRSLPGVLGPEPYGFQDRIGYADDMRIVYSNVRDLLAIGYSLEDVVKLPNAPDYMSVRFICDRGIANELITHRVLSKDQESTRFCNYSKEVYFVFPEPFPSLGRKASTNEAKRDEIWQRACRTAARFYKQLIELGASPQEARNVLPLSLKTELIVTTTYDKWEGVLALRLDKDAHPQMVYLMEMLVNNSQFPKDKIKLPKKEEA